MMAVMQLKAACGNKTYVRHTSSLLHPINNIDVKLVFINSPCQIKKEKDILRYGVMRFKLKTITTVLNAEKSYRQYSLFTVISVGLQCCYHPVNPNGVFLPSERGRSAHKKSNSGSQILTNIILLTLRKGIERLIKIGYFHTSFILAANSPSPTSYIFQPLPSSN